MDIQFTMTATSSTGWDGIAAGDAASLNRHLFIDASLDRNGAEALFDLERTGLVHNDAWTTHFIAAVVDHVVWGERPTGRLDEAKARWLVERVDEARTPAAFAILVAVLDEAQDVPSWFKAAVRIRALAGWPGLPREEGGFMHPVSSTA